MVPLVSMEFQKDSERVVPDTKSARPENSRECMDSYVYEERNEEKRRDRYYHRPPSPRPHDYKRPFTSSKL